ncbi:MAG: IMP dehydrogenase [Spirochaetales bacterium]|nr:IMP dehydrogenase [Spirochaetales bacterium]
MELLESLSYDDVLLQPGYSEVLPGETDLRTTLFPGVTLNVPILSAAMDTVTEERLAIALALEGGVGVIHRNLNVEQQADQVAKVKRYLNWVIESPITVSPSVTVEEVWGIMNRQGFSGLPVIENDGTLVGIITSRDLRFCRDYSKKVSDIMTSGPIAVSGEPTLEKAQQLFDDHKIEKLPVVDENKKLTGLITVKDMEKHRNHPRAAVDKNGRLLVGAAVGPSDLQKRLDLLVRAKADFLVIDSAHGTSKNVLSAIGYIKENYDIPVVGGNVATREGAKLLIEAGADAIKVGVGPGSICTTRIVAGIGVPQFSAVLWAAEEAAKAGIPVIADGGIKYSGDLVKAIGAGASAVMIGGLFAGLKESPGREVIYEGRIFKTYRGMGSLGAIKSGSGDRYQIAENEDPVPEGVEGRVPYKGELRPYLHQLITGLRKGMGYTGCKTIGELRRYQKFIKITSAGLRESHVHDVSITQEPPNYSR